MMIADVSDHKGRSHDSFLFTNASGIRRSPGERSDGEGDHATTSTCGSGQKRLRTTARGAAISPREKKDKVGERITRLQQLVSPFGKSDTSSVLQEAAAYIKFLHEQLEVLTAPYLRVPVTTKAEEEDGYDCSLRRRGLCLVPIDSVIKIAQNNGADLWAPASST